MPTPKNIAHVASLIGDGARATMLIALLGGKAMTAGELSIRANISAQTVSNHLKKLLAAGMIVCEPRGRYRYFSLASAQVAHALESLAIISRPSKASNVQKKQNSSDISFARTCYDHLAGKLSVTLTHALIKQRLLIKHEDGFKITKNGKQFFAEIGVDIDELKTQRRQFAKQCLDWTERQPHIAGSLGAAILDYFMQNRFVIRSKTKPRVIVLTRKGRLWLAQRLKIKGP